MRRQMVLGLVLVVSSVFTTAGAQAVPPRSSEGVAPAEVSVPDEARLKARIQDFYTALGSRDSRAMYDMQTPYIKSRMSFRDYKKDWQLDEAWAAEPHSKLTVSLEQVCFVGPWAYPDGSETLRSVLLLNGVEEQPGGQQRTAKFLESWEYTNGEWYYGYPGDGNHCPSHGGGRQ